MPYTRIRKLDLVDLSGKSIAFDQPAPPLVRAATDAWLTPDGLILQAQASRLYGRGWTTAKARAATVGDGRIVYVAGRSLRVRRIQGGPDRLLLTLPTGDVQLAAGSFGVAIALDQGGGKVTLYRLSWRTIDKTRTA